MIHRLTSLKYGLFAGCALAVMSGTAHAADAPAATDSASSEIIVTAQRRNESVQSVPMTLQALSSDALSKLNVTTFNDLLKYTPNVTFGNNGPGQGAIFMRGLSSGFAGGQSAGTIASFPNVALYLDDQSMQFPGHNADVYVADIERVEVLEGPQGTLFGGGAEAGAVRYITAKPKVDKIEGKIEGSFGGTAGGAPNAAFNAMINLPIIQDKLAIRAVVYDDHHGGYINNVYSTFTRQTTDLGFGMLGQSTPLTAAQQSNGGQYNNAALVKNNYNPVDYVGGRVSLQWDVAPDWNVLVTESYQNMDAEGTFSTEPTGPDYQTLGSMQTATFTPSYNRDDYWNTAWTVNGKIGDFKVIYTGAYMARHITVQQDYTNYARAAYGIYYQCTGGSTGWGSGAAKCYAPYAYWNDQLRTTHASHEVRIASPDDKRIRAIVGGYYEALHIYDNMNFNYKTIPQCTATVTTGCSGLIYPVAGATTNVPGARSPATAFGEDTQRGYDQFAFFGSVDFDIFSNLTLTGGTRYYNYREYEIGSQYETNPSNCYDQILCTPNGYGNVNIDGNNDHVVYHGFKSKATLTWKPLEHTIAYGTWSQGFRPGGFNRTAPDVLKDPDGSGLFQLQRPNSYKPDTLTNWEAGLKTDLFDHKVQFNLSGYYMIWASTQTQFFDPADGFGNTTFVITGPTYHIKGLETQVVARPIQGLSVQGSGTYNDSKQSNSPCLISNIATSSTYGQCITERATSSGTASVTNPLGQVGSITPFSPHIQANLRGRYEWAGKNDLNWFVSGGGNYTGAMYSQPANFLPGDQSNIIKTTLLRYRMPGYATLDASFGVTRDKWTVTIFGENLTNTHSSTFTSSAQYIKSEVPVRPLIYGLKISTTF